MGPALFRRPVVEVADQVAVPNYAVVQDDHSDNDSTRSPESGDEEIKKTDPRDVAVTDKGHNLEGNNLTYEELVARGRERFHAKLRTKRGPLGWAMRTLHTTRQWAQAESTSFRT